MRRLGVKVTTAILKQLSLRSAKNFTQALTSPEKSQQSVLRTIINNLACSAYGQHFKASPKIGYEEFSQRIPIVGYDDLLPWITQIQQGNKNILTPHPVQFFQKTAGSSGPAKYIPYNKALLDSFNNMFRIWIYDVLSNFPYFQTGKIFMSISPADSDRETTTGHIAVGLNDDSNYLHSLWRNLMQPFVVYPPNLSNKQTIEEFRYQLAKTLLAEEELEVISIWNPSYFLVLLETINLCRERLLDDFGKKSRRPLSHNRKQMLIEPAISWQELWPKLKFISCWSSANATISANRLRNLFPKAILQSKGLLTTEAPLTVPLFAAPGHLPLANEIFFEFKDSSGHIRLLHQLTHQETYQLIISQKGGLYRYAMNDVVKVVATYSNTPCLEFIGRRQAACDIVGEKLTEDFVSQTLSTVADNLPYCMLIPSINTDGFGQYLLLMDSICSITSKQLDDALCKGFHYRNARLLGQLREPKLIIVTHLNLHIQDFMIQNGMRWGEIKDRVLLTDLKLAERLLDYINIDS